MAYFEQFTDGWWRAVARRADGRRVAMTASSREAVDEWVAEIESGDE